MSNSPFYAKNFSDALGRVRNAPEGSVVLDRSGVQNLPSSPRYRAQTMKRSNIDKSAFMYGANKKTPYSTNIIRDEVLGWEMAVDTVERLNENVAKRREFRHFIEAIVLLSTEKRRRVWKLVLFPPFQKILDPNSFRDSRLHQEQLQARSAHHGHFTAKKRGLLAEDNLEELFKYDHKLRHNPAEQRAIQNLSVSLEGFLQIIRDVADGQDEAIQYSHGTPGPETMIRLSLDNAFGIIFSRKSLDTDAGLELVSAWLKDIKDFTSGDKRDYYWDERIRAYRRRHEDDEIPPANAVEMMLKQLEDNLTPVNQPG